MTVVVFDYSLFAIRFPELASVPSSLVQLYFNEAGDAIDNTDCSPITDVPPQGGARTRVLLAATAHITALNAIVNGQLPSALVGRITNGTQGSISVAAQMDVPGGSGQWWNQTRYGAQVWNVLAPFRSARYVPGPVRNMNPWGRRGPWGV